MNLYRLESRVAAEAAKARVPGLALAIIEHREVIFARGFGVTSVEAGGVSCTPDTLFQIGSVTKSLTGTAIVALAGRGLLDLDAPVTTYVPGLTLGEPAAATPVTLRQLLSHTSGLPWDQITPRRLFGPRDPAGLAAYVERELPARALVAPPGTLFNYSNPGFNLAGRVAEVVTGTTYPELMARSLFEPLGMTRTTFDPTVAMTHAVAQSHDVAPDGALQVRRPAPDNTAQYPAAFAYSTVLDLARFACAHLSGGRAEGGTVLTRDAVVMMRTPHAERYEGLDTAYGLAFYLDRHRGVTLVGHPGGINSLGSQLWLVPERGAGVVVLYNRAEDFERTARRLATEILVELLDLPAGAPPPVARLEQRQVEGYAGVYVDDGGTTVTVRATTGGLELMVDGVAMELIARRPDLFSADDPVSGRGRVAGFPPLPAPGTYLRFDGRLYRRAG